MPLDIIYSPTMLSVISASLLILALILCGALLNGELTRPIVMILGVGMIVLGAVGHVQFLDMQGRGAKLVAEKFLSQSIFDDFLKYQAIFVYLFPAVSAAIGTNVISDALLKHHTYQKSFSLLQFIKDCSQIITIPLMLLFCLVAVPVLLVFQMVCSFVRQCRHFAPLIFRACYLKLCIIARHALRKKLDN
ncbi:hypothetical protein ACCC96_28985 [Pseudomonas sp. Pseusp11]|uniref:hypothetical protein n=1 Tax=Pseudomonas sp. Pseusp11 TaxID=3243003 RepID=UPI0039B3E7FE